VEVGNLPPAIVSEGDVVPLPANTSSASRTSATAISFSSPSARHGS